MYQIIAQFLAQFVISYLLFSVVLVAVTVLFLRIFPLNAAARHRIWLTALLVLVFAPLVALLPRGTVDSQPGTPASGEIILSESAKGIDSLKQNSLDVGNFQGSWLTLQSESIYPGLSDNRLVESFALDSLSKAFVETPLYREISFTIFFILGIGLAFKLFRYIRSLYSLAALIDSSEAVDGEWLRILERCCGQMNISRSVEIRRSNIISTPSTCGVFSPRIILPTAMVKESDMSASGAQIIYHELAHIKRHDPLVAGVIALLGVFYFWHPAVNFIARKIRFERELACDDWVIRNCNQQGYSGVKAYAYSLVGIAESLGAQAEFSAHTLACVDKEAGLQTRIGTLLDRQADHSTTVQLVPNVSMAALALVFVYLAAGLLPKIPSSVFSSDSQPGLGLTDASPLEHVHDWTTTDFQPNTVEPVDDGGVSDVLQIADYEVPKPVLDMVPNASSWKPEVILSRAENIKSTFLSELPDPTPAAAVTVEPIDLDLDKFSFEAIDDIRSHSAALGIEPSESTVPRAESVNKKDRSKMSRSELAAEILNVELEIYRIFNAVTEREDLKMVCEKGLVLGSYISQTTCEPEFLRNARSENARDRIITSKYQQYSVPANLRTNLEAGYAEFAAELLKEMRENRQLLSLYQTLTALKVQQADAA